jgi:orotidine-5'-phosphate decarboxylase
MRSAMTKGKNEPRIIVALDYHSADSALSFADSVTPSDCKLKIGLELFTIAGAPLVEKLTARGFDIFLDLKFHDIPNTVAQACRAAAGMGVWMMNVHALGGPGMLAAAREAVDACAEKPLLIGVTILTSHNQEDLQRVGLKGSPGELVANLASMAREAGLDGVVCSPLEAADLKVLCGESFLLVTPGVRPVGSDTDDQQRVMAPAKALSQGADYLVIGRPITKAADPVAALADINRSIQLKP